MCWLPRIVPVLLFSTAVFAQTTTLTGVISDESGGAIPSARVFIEPGAAGDVAAGTVDAAGAFSFTGAYQGAVGIFAVAEGFGFGGVHVNAALGETVAGLRIILSPACTLSGRVVADKNTPVAGARITRVAVLSSGKVGIPLSKLAEFGFSEPVSARDGSFSVGNLPANTRVALKAVHPDYAQEAVENIASNASDAVITLYRGVLLRGEVRTRANQSPVSGASVVVRNAQPPHDSSLVKTDGFGVYSLRLKPGVYLCQATASGMATPGWQRVTITGETPETTGHLGLAAAGSVRGSIADAVSGKPIEGARIRLESSGNIASVVRTGPNGEFNLTAAEGDNVVYFEATPGFLPPDPRAIRVIVTGGKALDLPGMWLAPLPNFRVQAVGEDEKTPVAGAVITLLRPRQTGWLATDKDGWADIRVANLPADGRIIGMVEHPSRPDGAVFAIDRAQAAGALVKLIPFGTVSGTVLDARGNPAANVPVGAAFPESAEAEPLLMWRTVTDAAGRFVWPAVPAGIPQQCAVGADSDVQAGPAPFNLAPGEAKELGNITIRQSASGRTPSGAPPANWRAGTRLCGPEPAAGPALLVYCDAGEADLMVETLSAAMRAAGSPPVQPVLFVRGGHTCGGAPIPVFSGSPPGAAGTLLLDSGGALRMATFGLPPLHLLRGLK